jgi:hypothetical protein
MAFTDWDTFLGGGDFIVLQETSVPLFGNASLRIEKLSPGGSGGGAATPSVASGLTRGLTAGRMRTVMKRDAGSDSATTYAGIFFLLGSVGTPFVNSSYSVAVHGSGDVSIQYHASSLPVVTDVIATKVGAVSNLSTNFILEAMWFSSDSFFGGTHIEVKVNGTPIPELIVNETTYALSGTGGEGLYHATFGGATQLWLFDTTQLYSVDFI